MTRQNRFRLSLGLLVVVAIAALPGRFLFEPTLLDSYPIRAKTRLLSTAELFLPSQSEVINSFWRPLFHLLHSGVDRLAGGNDVGLRALALAAFAFAAFALARFGRSIALPRRTVAGGVLLFLLAPPNVTTAAWPVAASWSLGVGFTLLAATEFIRSSRAGGGGFAWRGLVWMVMGLASSEAPWPLALLPPLLCLVPPSLAVRRRHALLLLLPVALLVFIHLHWLEVGGVAADRSERLSLRSLWACVRNVVPHYLEGGLGGDLLTGAPWISWIAWLLIALGAWRTRQCRFLALLTVATCFPFAVVGHTDRYALLAHALSALLFAAAVPEGLLRLACRSGRPSRRVVVVARAGSVIALAAILFTQAESRLDALASANREARQVAEGVRAAAPSLKDLDRIRYINAPAYLHDVVLSLQPALTRAMLVPPPNDAALCTATGYFSMVPLEEVPGAARVPFEWDGERFIARATDAPLGLRRPLPPVFLAGGVEVVSRPLDGDVFADLAFEEALLERVRQLVDPQEHVLVEQRVEGLGDHLPTSTLEWSLEPVEDAVNDSTSSRLFDPQVRATVAVDRMAFLVVAGSYLRVADPLRWVTGDLGRWHRLFEAELDGVAVSIAPAFGHLCGVVVPPGTHSIVVRARCLGEHGSAKMLRK